MRDTRVPSARSEHLVTVETDDGILMYDLEANEIHQLDATSTTVWQLCDGERTIAQLARVASLDEDTVVAALVSLDRAELLTTNLPAALHVGQTRRTRMKSAAVADKLPLVVSLSALVAAPSLDCQVPCTERQIRNCCGEDVPGMCAAIDGVNGIVCVG